MGHEVNEALDEVRFFAKQLRDMHRSKLHEGIDFAPDVVHTVALNLAEAVDWLDRAITVQKTLPDAWSTEE